MQIESPIETESTLQEKIRLFAEKFLSTVDTQSVTNLHEMMLEQIESPMLQVVMDNCKYNQVKAAKMLGISRGTLRKKFIQYFDDKYCGKKEDY